MKSFRSYRERDLDLAVPVLLLLALVLRLPLLSFRLDLEAEVERSRAALGFAVAAEVGLFRRRLCSRLCLLGDCCTDLAVLEK